MPARVPAPDVIVVGGGILGVSAAAFLAEGGAAVSVVEASAIGAGASGRNSGVVQHPFDPALRELHLETLAIYRSLAGDELSLSLPDEPAGLLLVSLSPGAPRRIAADLTTAWPELEPELVDEDRLRRLEPGLAPGVAACRLRIGYPVPPERATRALASLAERRGAGMVVGTAVAGLVRDGDRVAGVRLADGTTIAAGAVLVAAGPSSPRLLDPGGRWRPVRPVWGVVVEVGLADPPRHVLEEAEMDEALGEVASTGQDRGDGSAIDPPIDPEGERPDFSLVTAAGRSSLGSTFLDHEPDPAAWIGRLIAGGRRFVPAIGDARVGPVRSCARPMSVDGRPLLGAVPGLPGAFVASGHGPWGISTGPASGRLVAATILGRPVTIPAELDAVRFGPVG